jgi:T-lymphoma invasion and metastasis-inducing protein 1
VRTRNVSTLLQHLNNLLENYLEPLKKETFLSNAEVNALFGNIQEIVAFQRQFLQNLDEALELEPDFHKFEHPSQFKVSVLSIIDYQDHVFFLIYLLQIQ